MLQWRRLDVVILVFGIFGVSDLLQNATAPFHGRGCQHSLLLFHRSMTTTLRRGILIAFGTIVLLGFYFAPRLGNRERILTEVARRNRILEVQAGAQYLPIEQIKANPELIILAVAYEDSAAKNQLSTTQIVALKQAILRFLSAYSTADPAPFRQLRRPQADIPVHYDTNVLAFYRAALTAFQKNSPVKYSLPTSETDPEEVIDKVWAYFGRYATINQTKQKGYCVDCWQEYATNQTTAVLRVLPQLPNDIRTRISRVAPNGGRQLQQSTILSLASNTSQYLICDVIFLVKTDRNDQIHPFGFSAFWDSERALWLPFQAAVGVNSIDANYLF